MYPLTDFTPKELSLMIASLDESIREKNAMITGYNSWGDDLSILMKESTKKLHGEVTTLIEIKVRTITAFGIVTEREKIYNG
jgi:hypothetical protein